MAPSRAQLVVFGWISFPLLCGLVGLHLGAFAERENSDVDGIHGNVAPKMMKAPARGSPEYLQLFVEEAAYYNRVALFFLPKQAFAVIPHPILTWMRNMVAGHLVYFIGSGLWALAIYRTTYFFDKENRPKRDDMLKQIWVSLSSMPFYTSLPTFSEWMVEQGWTLCYARIDEVGVSTYIAYQIMYLVIVEVGVYWAHRWLHDIKFLYEWLHKTHHVYNKQHTLSPFAGLAFHPLDGIIQASPNVIALFLVPTHFFTHLLCLFMEGIWTTNIHDCIDGNVWLIMGAGYHTIHHTTYRHNYGHYTIFMDWLFGTLKDPEGRTTMALKVNGTMNGATTNGETKKAQ